MVRDDLSAEQYHDDATAIGKSGLDYVARSPAHYYAAYLDPHRVREEATPAMILGTCYHYASLEPAKFKAKVIGAPVGDRRTKEGKKAYAEFLALHPGKIILPQEDYDTVRRMRDVLHAHPAARVLITGGVTERSFYWKDADTGVLCKCRPDYARRDGVLVDLKSAEDARPDAFARSSWNYRYYVQAPWYMDGVGHAASWDGTAEFARPEVFAFIVQEKSPPYSVMVYEATRQFLDTGRMEYTRNLTTYAACLREGYWPAYPEEILPIDLPSWAVRNAARLPA